jgi:hypothetical protein
MTRAYAIALGRAPVRILVVAVLRHNELGEIRFQRHHPVVARRDHRGGQHGVEILGLVFAAFAMGTVPAMDLVRAVESSFACIGLSYIGLSQGILPIPNSG